MNLKESAKVFLATADENGGVFHRSAGSSLASALRKLAIDMSYSKATDCSPEIPELFLLAAQVAYVTFGPGAPELERYEKEVFYYAKLKLPGPTPAAYEAFKARWQQRIAAI